MDKKNNLLVDLSLAIEPHLKDLSDACLVMVDAGKRMRLALEKGDSFTAGPAADELARASDKFSMGNKLLLEASYKVYALYGQLDTAEEVVSDAMQWAHASAKLAGKPVGQA